MIENLTGPGQSIFSGPAVLPSPVKIVRVHLELLKMRMAELGIANIGMCYLRPQERERFHSFRYEKRRIEWLAGRIAAKCAGLQLQNNDEKICWGKKQWQQLQIAADISGRPFILWSIQESNIPAHISISHSRGYAIAMAAWDKCGVDIQQVTPAVERVEVRFVSAGEKNLLAEIVSLHGSQAALTLLWSAKEAVKKTCGSADLPGFQDIRLQSLQMSGAAYVFRVQVKAHEQGQKLTQFVRLRLLDGYAYAVTIRNNEIT